MNDVHNDTQSVKLVAASLCAGLSPQEIIERLTRIGYGGEQVAHLIDELGLLRQKPNQSRNVVILVCGVLFIGVGLVLTVASGFEWLWYGPMITGMIFLIVGLNRLSGIAPPLNTEQLIEAWERSHFQAGGRGGRGSTLE